jgi:hypothetical protein
MDTTVGQEKADKAENTNDSDEGLRPRIEELRQRMETLNERVKGFIKEHPAACLMGALGLGYLFARIASRRS